MGRGGVTDADGAVFVTGYFSETVDFDPRGGGDIRRAVGFSDAFLTKLGPDGSYLWTRTFGGQAGSAGGAIALDRTGRLVLSGGYSGTVDFDPSEGVDEHTSNGREDAFLARLTTDGDYRFTDTFGGSEIDAALDVTFDPDVLASWGIRLDELAAALRQQNVDVSAGDFSEGKRRYVVRTLSRFESPADVEEAVITTRGGVPVRVRCTLGAAAEKPAKA